MSNILIAGSTGLLGFALQNHIVSHSPDLIPQVFCTRRSSISSSSILDVFVHNSIVINDLQYESSWRKILDLIQPSVIVLISNIRHLRPLLHCMSAYSPSTNRPRLIIVGTTGVFSCFSNYSSEYIKLEALLADYSGSYLLLRPSMIYGTSNDKNMHKVIDFICRFKCFPIFGRGDNLLQPVYYMDIVHALYFGILNDRISGSFNLPGLYPVTYNSLILTIFKQLEIKPRIVHLPLHSIAFLIRILPAIVSAKLPFTEEQVVRLSEHKFLSYSSSVSDLSYSPHSFVDGISKQIHS